MGLFNELITGADNKTRVQFKYGFCWQIEYQIGDKISWGHRERPVDADHEIIVPGIGGGECSGEWSF